MFILTGSVFKNPVKLQKVVAKVMIFSRGALADLFALTRFLIPVAFTDTAVDIGEQVTAV